MIDQFIGTLFLARDVAHREHLRTKSYAQHMALGSFYNDIADLMDSLTEAYQGRYGIIPEIPILTESKKYKEALYCLAEKLDYIEKNRYKAIPKEDSALQNIVDEIVGLFLSLIYKLENLK
jgi:hypothetical protein